ncbi:MAG: YHS domain-containing protein [Gloeobacteraceae cyanobacterium ES-bin-144]|nr:YHS domain-containing protein [Verrucomicrobiales bacterium]
MKPIEPLTQEQIHSGYNDPVCGMSVDPTTALHAEQEGETFYFCSEQCRQKFLTTTPEANPYGRSGGSGG